VPRHFVDGGARKPAKAAKAARQLPRRPVDAPFTGFTTLRLVACRNVSPSDPPVLDRINLVTGKKKPRQVALTGLREE